MQAIHCVSAPFLPLSPFRPGCPGLFQVLFVHLQRPGCWTQSIPCSPSQGKGGRGLPSGLARSMELSALCLLCDLLLLIEVVLPVGNGGCVCVGGGGGGAVLCARVCQGVSHPGQRCRIPPPWHSLSPPSAGRRPLGHRTVESPAIGPHRQTYAHTFTVHCYEYGGRRPLGKGGGVLKGI